MIHLDELSCLELLGDFPRILVPEAVWTEVRHHRPQALEHPQVRLERTAVPARRHPRLEALAQAFTLHPGEAEALRVALEAPEDCLLLTDDTAARLAAQSLQLRVHGTIGILIRAIRRGQLDRFQVISHLEAIPTRSTLHVRSGFLAKIIEQISA